jgi:hypothetical protein
MQPHLQAGGRAGRQRGRGQGAEQAARSATAVGRARKAARQSRQPPHHSFRQAGRHPPVTPIHLLRSSAAKVAGGVAGAIPPAPLSSNDARRWNARHPQQPRPFSIQMCGRRWAPRVAPPHKLNNFTWSLRAGRGRRQVPQLGARRAWQLSSSMPPRRSLRASSAAASPREGSQRDSRSRPGSPGPPVGRADPLLARGWPPSTPRGAASQLISRAVVEAAHPLWGEENAGTQRGRDMPPQRQAQRHAASPDAALRAQRGRWAREV